MDKRVVKVRDFTKKEVFNRYSKDYEEALQTHKDMHKYYKRDMRLKVTLAVIGVIQIEMGYFLAGLLMLMFAWGIVANVCMDNRYLRFMKEYPTLEKYIEFYHGSSLLWDKNKVSSGELIIHDEKALLSVTCNDTNDRLGLYFNVICSKDVDFPEADVLKEVLYVPVGYGDGKYIDLKIL